MALRWSSRNLFALLSWTGAGDIVAQQEIPKLGIIHVRKGDQIPGIAQARVVGHKIEDKSTFRRRKSFRSQRR
jgi:hypothetical protein